MVSSPNLGLSLGILNLDLPAKYFFIANPISNNYHGTFDNGNVSTTHRHDDSLRIRPADTEVPVDRGEPPLHVLPQQLGELQ